MTIAEEALSSLVAQTTRSVRITLPSMSIEAMEAMLVAFARAGVPTRATIAIRELVNGTIRATATWIDAPWPHSPSS